MTAGYIYAGRITEVVANGVMLTVPLLAGTVPQGPIETSVPDLAVGDRVIVSNLGDSADALVVLGRLPGRPSSIAEIPNLQSRLVAIEGVNTTQNSRLDSLETRANTGDTTDTTQNNRLTSVEGRATSLETRATSVETVNGQQNTRLTAVESKNTEQDTRLTTAEGATTTLRADTAGKVTTKGDLLVATAAGVLTRQPVGAAGTVLTPDSTQAGGVAWSDPYALVSALPLGVVGRNRRASELSTQATTSTAGARVISTRAPVRVNRLYELRVSAMMRHSTANAKGVLTLYGTLTDVEPTTSDSILQQKIFDMGAVTGSSVDTSLSVLWATSVADAFLRIMAVMSTNTGTVTLSAGSAVPVDIWITELGPNPAVSGTVY